MSNRSFFIVAGVLAVLVVVGGVAYAYDSSREDHIAEGVKVGGVDIGDMTADKARAKLERTLLEPLDDPIVVHKGSKKFKLSPKQARVAMNLDAMVNEALDRSREGNVLTRTFDSITGTGVDAELPARVTYSQGAVNRLVRRVKRSLNRAPRDRKSTRLNSSHANISYAVFCLKKKKTQYFNLLFYKKKTKKNKKH